MGANELSNDRHNGHFEVYVDHVSCYFLPG
jgi:hypothetical protein